MGTTGGGCLPLLPLLPLRLPLLRLPLLLLPFLPPLLLPLLLRHLRGGAAGSGGGILATYAIARHLAPIRPRGKGCTLGELP